MAQEFDRPLAKLSGLTARDFGLKGSEGRDQFNRGMKAALQEMMFYWHRVYLPLHFSPVAFARYPGFAELYGQWKKKVSARFMRVLAATGGEPDPSTCPRA